MSKLRSDPSLLQYPSWQPLEFTSFLEEVSGRHWCLQGEYQVQQKHRYQLGLKLKVKLYQTRHVKRTHAYTHTQCMHPRAEDTVQKYQNHFKDIKCQRK